MQYKAVRSGKLLDAVLRARGFDPDYTTLSDKEKMQYEDIVNQALREVWEAELWPQLLVVEQRRYRPTWAADATYAAGNEVWYAETYWESLSDVNIGNTPVAGSVYWQECTETMLCYLPFEQPWTDDNGNTVDEIDPAGVELGACVYDLDPLIYPDAHPIEGCRFWMNSILVPQGVAPAEPYVRFRPSVPIVSYTAWVEGTDYTTGELCYLASTGESYRARRPTTGDSPDDSTDDWGAVQIPAFCENYCRLYAKAELAADDEGKYKSFGQARTELERLAERYVYATGSGGSAVFRWKRGV